MSTWLQDLRYAARLLIKSPGFTLLVAATLAIGIGANTAIFSCIEALLLRPLPFHDPDRLVMVWEQNYKRDADRNVVSPANFTAWRERSQSFDDLAGFANYDTNLIGVGRAERLAAGAVTGNLFSMLGVTASMGRTFQIADSAPGAPDVVLVGDGLWKRRFASAPDVVGRTVTLNGEPRTIVGVMAPSFQLPPDVDVWVPLTLSEQFANGSGRWLKVVARLKAGVAPAQAGAEMVSIAKGLEREFPDRDAGWSATVAPLHSDLVTDVRAGLLVLMGAVGFVLLIGCANVANLLLARAIGRERELAIRAALGASALRLARQMLIESLLLALAGGILSLLVASWTLDGLLAIAPPEMPSIAHIGLNWRALFFTLGISLACTLLFGLAPAVQFCRPALRSALTDGARGTGISLKRHRLRNGVVIAEVGLALVLLVGAGLIVKSFWRLSSVDPGFRSERVLSFQLSLPGAKYPDGPQQVQFFTRTVDAVKALPSVEAVGAMSWRPFGRGSATDFRIPDRPIPRQGEEPVADIRVVTPDLFSTLGIPLERGRIFSTRDAADRPSVVIVNRALARQFWPNENPLGKHIAMEWGRTIDAEIVGVVGDVRLRSLDAGAKATLYWPLSQFPNWSMTVMVRSAQDEASLVNSVQTAVAAVDPEIPIANVEPLGAVVSDSLQRQRFVLLLLGGFAGIALLLAAVGLFGLMSYAVSQRTQELGVRLALGATARDILALVIGQGFALTMLGLVAGLLGALALTRFLAGLLFEVSPTDPSAIAAVCLVLMATALLASFLPARRATKVEPITALRME